MAAINGEDKQDSLVGSLNEFVKTKNKKPKNLKLKIKKRFNFIRMIFNDIPNGR